MVLQRGNMQDYFLALKFHAHDFVNHIFSFWFIFIYQLSIALILWKVTEVLELFPVAIGREAGYMLERSTVYHKANA